MKKKWLISPKVFDAIHIGSLAAGGLEEWKLGADDYGSLPSLGVGSILANAGIYLSTTQLDYFQCDQAVRAVKKRLGKQKVTFEQFIKEMNIDISPVVE